MMKYVTGKRQLIAVLVFFSSGIACLHGQIFKNSDLSVSLLFDDTWVIETPDMTTMYLLEGKNKALLVDTGTKCDSLDKVIGHITSKPFDVVITHVHPDHAGNIGYFDKIFIHPADTVLLQKKYLGKVSFVNDDYQFDLGDRIIEVSHMPGHTPGSIILLDWKNNSCFTGDAFGSGQVWLQLRPFSPIRTYINSCSKMETLMERGIEKIYCGHYPYIKKPFDLNYITRMKNLAISLDEGKLTGAEPYPVKVPIGAENPLSVSDGTATIVFDPEHIH